MKISFTPQTRKFVGIKQISPLRIMLKKMFLQIFPNDTQVLIDFDAVNNQLLFTVENSERKIFTNTSFEIQYKK